MKFAVVALLGLSTILMAEQTYQLNVKNMGCMGCVNGIKKAASQVTNIIDIKPDFRSKDVNLTVPDGTDINLVMLSIRLAKYQAVLKK